MVPEKAEVQTIHTCCSGAQKAWKRQKPKGSQSILDEVCQGQEVPSSLRVRYEVCRGTRWF